MTEKQKTALGMRANGATYDEIAKQLGISEAAAFGLVKRGVSGKTVKRSWKYASIADQMAAMDMSATQLADAVNVARPSMYLYLRGERTPNLRTAFRIADVLNLTVEQAFREVR